MTASKLGPALRQIHRLFDETSTVGLDDATLLDRFARSGDQSAFRSIVDRHGPMVLATCRATLRDPSMAEDAFQATFLVLARRVRSIREPQAIGGWLHRVARRVANRANLDAALRHRREREAGEIRDRINTSNRDDTASTLHEEIDRLPERYRMPVVLCHLEGLTHAEAARRLRRGERTLRRHLAEALPRLRTRLVRRGVTLSTLAIVATLERSARAAVPESWATMAGSTCPRAVVLSTGILSASFGLKLKLASVAAVGLLTSACLATSVIARGDRASTPPTAAQAATPPAPADPQPKVGSWIFAGKVVDPNGKPVAGATLRLDFEEGVEHAARIVRATSGPDGSFRFASPRPAADEVPYEPHVVAVFEGFGLGLSDGDEPDAGREVTVRMARDDAPIEGRVVDLEGRPVIGASARVITFWAPDSRDMTPWIEAAKAEGQAGYAARVRLLRTRIDPMDDTSLFHPAVTGADGRFRLVGVGRERLVSIKVEGPSIRPTMVTAITRPGPRFQVPHVTSEMMSWVAMIHGSTFDLAVPPSRPLEGTIRDVDTGRPIPGVALVDYKLADDETGNSQMLRATTDEQGRYRLTGLPRGKGNVVMIIPSTDGEPYLPSWVTVDDAPGLGPIALDLTLKRGILATGKVVDKASGKPLRASVLYHAMAENPHVNGAGTFRQVQYSALQGMIGTKEDGSYRVAVLPGRGMLKVGVFDVGYPFLSYETDTEPMVPMSQTIVHAKARIDVLEASGPINTDFAIDAGRSIEATVVDPDGRPLVGTLAYGLGAIGYWDEPMRSSRFAIRTLRPPTDDGSKADEVRTLLFRHREKRLAGWVDVKWDEAGPLTIRLQPCAEVVGRVVDAEGKPRANVSVVAYVVGKKRRGGGRVEHDDRRVLTGPDGRFRLEGVVAGLAHQLNFSVGDRAEWVQIEPVASGKVLDRGDIKLDFGN